MPASPTRRVTRAKNANTHPGLIALPEKRSRSEAKSKKVLAAERKAEKEEVRASKVSRIGEVKKRKAAEEANNATPRVVHTIKVPPGQLHRTESYLDLAPTAGKVNDLDHDMMVDQPSDSSSEYQGGQPTTDEHVSNDKGSTADEAPPKKRAKGPKVGIRDSIKAYVANAGGVAAAGNKGRSERDETAVEQQDKAVSDIYKIVYESHLIIVLPVIRA